VADFISHAHCDGTKQHSCTPYHAVVVVAAAAVVVFVFVAAATNMLTCICQLHVGSLADLQVEGYRPIASSSITP
jgi:hypothetical protein